VPRDKKADCAIELARVTKPGGKLRANTAAGEGMSEKS
jgi:hypothetical protein